MERFGRVEAFRSLLLVYWFIVGPVLAELHHPLPVLWMMPVISRSGRENLTVTGVGAAVKLALQDLKKQPPPLGNYEIQLQLLDSQCDPSKALKALFDAMWEGPKYLLVFGEVCPSVTAFIARSLPSLNLVQVSFAAMSPSQSNRKWYGNLFSTMPPDRALNQAAVQLLQRHNWTRVGVVTQEKPRLLQMKNDVIKQLLKADVEVVSTENLSNDVCSSLKKLKNRDVRIIIAQFEEDFASEVFCCAYRLNLFGPRYQWIVVDGETAGWRLGWRVSGCSVNSLLMAADGSFRLQIRALGHMNTPGVSGRTPQDYQQSYLKLLIQEGSKFSPLHAFTYDAVWVTAIALSQVIEAVKHQEKYSIHRNVTVSEEDVQKMLLEAVKNTQFEGVTGPVSFQNGERMSVIELIQFQDSSGVLVGEFSTASQQLRLQNNLLKFKGPGPARDRILVYVHHRRVNLILYSIISSVTAVTIIIALLILCFIIIHHKHWLQRSRCGCQDELLLMSILLSSTSVLIFGLDEASVPHWVLEIICSVRLWTLSVGHTIGFAVLFTKTWRTYFFYIIKQKQQSRLQGAGCVTLWMILLDVFVLTSWQILDPLRRMVLQHDLESVPADQDVIIQPYSEHCRSINTELWLTAIYGYKGPLLGLGCFLAWNIRSARVDHPAVSSKHLMLSMFALTVFSVSGVSLSLLTSHNPPVQFCLSSVLILCCNICIMNWMFRPVVLYLWSSSGKLKQPSELQGEAADEEEDEEQLRRFNQQLKSRTAEVDVEIETITTQLFEMSESGMFHYTTRSDKAGEVGRVRWNHEVQVCAEDGRSERKPLSPDDVNSPEHVQRRLSVQLPILHHSYLPAIGGISCSTSNLFSSWEACINYDVTVTKTTSFPPDDTHPEPRH